MGIARAPLKVNVIIGFIYKDPELFEKARKEIDGKFKDTADYESAEFGFSYTDYYAEEFGHNLKRKFLSLTKTVDPGDIYKVKIATNRLEKKFSRGGKRRINIDPGYMDLSKVVLLSTKDYSHRIYLKEGIFAEVTLFYKDKTFNPWPWTYPDYRTKDYINTFNEMRRIHKEKGQNSR